MSRDCPDTFDLILFSVRSEQIANCAQLSDLVSVDLISLCVYLCVYTCGCLLCIHGRCPVPQYFQCVAFLVSGLLLWTAL